MYYKQFVLIAFTAMCLLFQLNIKAQHTSLIAGSSFGYRVFIINDSIPDGYKNYQKSQKNGYTLHIEPVWYSENNGLGVKYAAWKNTVSATKLKVSDSETLNITETTSIVYVGLQFHKRKPFKNPKLTAELVAGLGVFNYKVSGKKYDIPFENKGKTYGLNASLSIEYEIINPLVIFILADTYIANLSELNIAGFSQKLTQRIGLSRIDLGAGVKYYF